VSREEPFMRVLLVGESLSPAFGGTAAAMAHHANYLVRAGVDVACVTFDGSSAQPAVRLEPGVRLHRARTAGPRRLGFSPDISESIDRVQPDVVHVHGLWRLPFAQAFAAAERRSVPTVISVHGMLHGRALRQRAPGKALARVLFQDRMIHRASCLHATAGAEAQEIRSAGFRTPVAIVPWGVELSAAQAAPEPPSSDVRPATVLYLGRLHPGKGLDTLVDAWRSVHRRFTSARLIFAGPNEDGYEARLKALASDLTAAGSIIFAGPADPDARERLFESAAIAVLPSPAENFGFVVPEALARGVPVIATHGAPWEILAAERCGWWVAADAASLGAALDEALRLPASELREMGARGRRLVGERFSWPAATAATLELYEWLRGRAPMPPFVKTAC
jgi:glycosyltransferase involved in cell wall biosynthesis